MQYIPIRLIPGCEPLLIDTKEIQVINSMQTTLSENFIKKQTKIVDITHKAVVYGVFKQQFNQSIRISEICKEKQLTLLQNDEIHHAQLLDIEIISSAITYSSIHQKERLNTNDIGFAALIDIPAFINIAKISSCYRIPAISLFEYDNKTPLIEAICCRTGIYAIKAAIAIDQEIDIENWRELINEKQANIVFSKTM